MILNHEWSGETKDGVTAIIIFELFFMRCTYRIRKTGVYTQQSVTDVMTI
jgi:hypothetical protein